MASVDKTAQDAYTRLLERGVIQDQMPPWRDDQRAIANVLARSAVFGVVERGIAEHRESQCVHAPSGYEITITGKRLSEAHRDVYMEVLCLFREAGPQKRVRLNSRAILRGIGRTDGGNNRAWLLQSLRDIAQTQLELKIVKQDGRLFFESALLTLLCVDGTFDNPTGVIASLPPEALRLYQLDNLTLIHAGRRLALKGPGSQLAKALQMKFCSHKTPYPMKLETLTDHCGVTDKDRAGRKRSLKRALELLVLAGELDNFAIEADGKVIVQRASRMKDSGITKQLEQWSKSMTESFSFQKEQYV